MNTAINAEMNTELFPYSQLRGRTVLIVGGTSGIGLATAKQAQAWGAKVIVVGFEPEKTEQVAKTHAFAGWRAADITKAENIQKAFADLPAIDHLVLLAGTFVNGNVLEADVNYLHRAFDERLWAAIHTLRVLGDKLARDGSVTLISGSLADRPNAYGTAVLASVSAAMDAFARGLALELAPIRFNTLSPGPIDTPLLNKGLGDAVEGLKASLPLRRLGTADEAAAAVVFLMANGIMNGATLNVDGGARLI